MEHAALVLSGEVGYERMTVEALVERSRSNLDRFYRAYRNKEQCFDAAYGLAIDGLTDRVLAAGARAADWSAGMREALEELAIFIAEDPKLARGLIAEVHVAGGASLAKRKQVFDRFSRAIDRARRQVGPAPYSPPPITPVFILSGIEAAIIRKLAFREDPDFSDLIGGLLYLSIAPYFGLEAARAEVRRLR